ncbi:MAG: zinc ribbon domain-containing protein [Candidatus Heimdallarchaeota archaeon]
MSLINLEEVSGTIIIQNKTFSAKDVLGAVIRESVPVEIRDGTLAIGIERIYPLNVSNSRDHPISEMQEYAYLVREIAQIKQEIVQINKTMHLSNRELERSEMTEGRSRNQFLATNSRDLRNTYINPPASQRSVPQVPFPEVDNGEFFDLFGEPEENNSSSGFLGTQKKCEKCGHILLRTAKFCNVCGSPTSGLAISSNNRGGREKSILR